MSTATRATTGARGLTANQRFRGRWNRHVWVSTAAAVVAHLLLFALAPGWVTERVQRDIQRWEGTPLLALPQMAGLPSSGPAPAAPLSLGEDEETNEEEGAENGASLDAESSTAMELWEAVGERLRRRGAPVPTVTEFESVAEADLEDGDGAGDDEDDPSVGGNAITTDLEDLPAPSSMDLDRLATIEPELALQSASAWVLIRNPTEVETYLRRGYRQGTLDPEVEGSVSVTLWINQRGSVEWAEVSESSGRPDLDEYALALFNEVAAFKAAREGGVAVSRSVTLSVNFPW